MPGRVNVKFVILLSVVLVLVFGVVAGAVYWVVSKSGEDYARLAQEREAEGDWEAAARSWSLAVSHDQDNLDWLNAWLAAQQQIIPETRLDYNEAFNDKYINVLRQIADLQRTDVDAHDRYLSERRAQLSGGFSASNEEFFLTEVGRVLGYFATEPEDGEWNRLRSYRGNSIVRLITNRVDQPTDREQLAVDDLEAALRVSPDDAEAFRSLVALHQFRAETARRERRFDAETEEFANANRVIDSFLAANRDSPLGEAIRLRLELSRRLAQLEREGDSDTIAEDRQALIESLQPQLGDLVQLTLASDDLELQAASLVVGLVGALDAPRLPEDGVAIWEAAIEQNPDDVLMRFSFAELLRRTGERDQAMEEFEVIAALPNIAVSSQGLLLFTYRNEAAYRQAVIALEMWETTEEPDAKALQLARARELEAQLLATRAETEPQMLLLAAKFAVAEDDYNLADRKLQEFNEATGSVNAEALRLTGIVAQRQDNPGAARRAFEQALAIEPNSVFTQISLAEVEQSLGNTDQAITLLQAASQQQPNNQQLRDRLTQLLLLSGRIQSDDPETALRIEAERSRLAGDQAAYIAVLERGTQEFPDSMVFHGQIARVYLQQNQRELAEASIDRALAIAPDDESLQRLKALVSVENPVEAGEDIIRNDQSLSELDRSLRLYDLYRSANDQSGAYAQLDVAIGLAPNDPRVLELAFNRALGTNDVESARSLLPAIRENDLDGAGGRTYEARVLILDGKTEEAENLVRASIDQGSTNAESYALLGRILESQGRGGPAIDAFAQGYLIRPNDIGILSSYLDALIRQRQLNRALEIARSALGTARSNANFRERWLLLEGQVGDREQALRERLGIAESNPDNTENNRQIISLLLDLGRYDQARQRIDATRANNDSFALAGLDARWHADRNDLNSARAVFVDYLVENADTLTGPQPYMAFGQFLIERRDIAGGLAAIQQAIRFQEDGDFTAQLFLGMQLFQLGRNEEAATEYERIVADLSEGDVQYGQLASIRSRLAEVYVRLGRFEDARDALAEVSTENANDLTMRLLRADIAAGTGDTSTAGTLLNEAIANAPDSLVALLKRAQFRFNQGETDDAVADLEQVLELNPRSVAALRLRATIRFADGDRRQAMDDLLLAVEASPDDTQLRLLAMNQLLSLDRPEDAADLAERGIRRSPSDLSLKLGAGDLFVREELFRRAITYYEQAWAQSKSLAVAQRYVDALISRTPADVETARLVANNRGLADSNANAVIAILKARVEGVAERFPQAAEFVNQAINDIGDNPAQLSLLFDALPGVFGTSERAAQFVRGLSAPQLSTWGEILACRFLANVDSSRSEGIERLRALMSGNLAPLQSQFVAQALSIALISSGDYEAAEQTLRNALANAPESAELLNNLAFVLVTELNRGEEALTLAERAAEVAPESPGVLDTLGFILLEQGDTARALETLQRATDLAGTGIESLPIRINLARALLRTGDRQAAETLADRLESAVDSDDALRDQYGERLENLQEEIRRG